MSRSIAALILIFTLLIGVSRGIGNLFKIEGRQLVYQGENLALYLFDLQTAYTRIISAPLENEIASMEWHDQKLSFALQDQIYSFDLQTGGLQSVTVGDVKKAEVVWSPDGQSMAFTDARRQHIYVADREGQIRKLTADAADYRSFKGLSWSPDGQWLAMINAQSSETRPALINVETGDITRLRVVLNSQAAPAWSPDGKSLAVSGYLDGESGIYIYELENGEVEHLPLQSQYVSSPAWSPDGGKFSFTVHHTLTDLSLGVSSRNGQHLNVFPAVDAANVAPSWSPDSQWIAFLSDDDFYLQPAFNLQASPMRVDSVSSAASVLWR